MHFLPYFLTTHCISLQSISLTSSSLVKVQSSLFSSPLITLNFNQHPSFSYHSFTHHHYFPHHSLLLPSLNILHLLITQSFSLHSSSPFSSPLITLPFTHPHFPRFPFRHSANLVPLTVKEAWWPRGHVTCRALGKGQFSTRRSVLSRILQVMHCCKRI